MMKFFGGLLMGVGILIAALSGLCSLIFLVSMNDSGALPLILVVGGLPFASGMGLFYWGRSLVRRARLREVESGGSVEIAPPSEDDPQ